MAFAKLLALWKHHHHGGNSRSKSRKKPSLLDAVLTRHPVLTDLTFGWYTIGVDLKKSQVKAGAKEQKIPLPTKDWGWFEAGASRRELTRFNKHYRDKPHIAWRVELNGNDQIAKFHPHDSSVTQFLGGCYTSEKVAMLTGDCSMRTQLDLGAERKRLAEVLTQGLTRVPKKILNEINNDPLGMLSWKHLVALTEKGVRE